jgi:hypothetical protein
MSNRPMTGPSEEAEAGAIARLVDELLAPAGGPTARGDAAPGDAALHAQAARDHRVALALRSDGPAPSLALLSTIERQTLGTRRPARRLARLAMRPAVAVACVAVVAIVGVAAGLTVGSTQPASGSGLQAAAALALKPAHAGPPAPVSATLLDATFGGVTYPNYQGRFGSAPTGERTDRIDGHRALTVYYRLRSGARMSYTIFSGAPVSVPAGAATVAFHGVTLRSFTASGGVSVVTLVRHGRTCVLAARSTPIRVLVTLAEWPLTVTSA